MESILGRMAGNMKANMLMIKKKAMECMNGLMGEDMKVCGLMGNNTGKESSLIVKERVKLGYGKMARGSNGLMERKTIASIEQQKQLMGITNQEVN